MITAMMRLVHFCMVAVVALGVLGRIHVVDVSANRFAHYGGNSFLLFGGDPGQGLAIEGGESESL
jgi:hypothetical protein